MIKEQKEIINQRRSENLFSVETESKKKWQNSGLREDEMFLNHLTQNLKREIIHIKN